MLPNLAYVITKTIFKVIPFENFHLKFFHSNFFPFENFFHHGSISSNFVRQAKTHRRTAFGEIDAIQFHQLFVTLNQHPTCEEPFDKLMHNLPNLCAIPKWHAPKEASHYGRKKKLGAKVDEIDPRSQFHQLLKSSFSANFLSPKNYKPKLLAKKSCSKHFFMKKLLV